MDVDEVDDSSMMEDDNPHRYLFSEDPTEHAPKHSLLPKKESSPSKSSPSTNYTVPHMKLEPEELPPQSTRGRNSKKRKNMEFDERFKATLDYHLIVTTILKLKDQKEQALADLRRLENEQQKSRKDPKKFVDSLLQKKDIIPRRQNVPSTPCIDFAVYESLPKIEKVTPNTSTKREPQHSSLNTESKQSNPITSPSNNHHQSHSSTTSRSRQQKRHSQTPKLVETSANAPWTAQEQSKFELLLVEHPDEPVSAHRWERIARALGTRTPRQVAARARKYFARLAHAGLPIPGRFSPAQKEKNLLTTIPKDAHTSIVYTKHLNYLESPAVKMMDIDSNDNNVVVKPRVNTKTSGLDDPNMMTKRSSSSNEMANNFGDDSQLNTHDSSKSLLDANESALFAGLEDTDEYKELIQLKKLQKFQQNHGEVYINSNPSYSSSNQSLSSNNKRSTQSFEFVTSHSSAPHIGSICSSCKTSPIFGSLYRCMTCHSNSNQSSSSSLSSNSDPVILCQKCFTAKFSTPSHDATSHEFSIERAAEFVDDDYLLTDESSYLDPNMSHGD